MADSVTLSIRLPAETRAKLERLAALSRRSNSFLAAEAIAKYVDHELAWHAAIQEGDDDFAAGRVFTHEQVMEEIDAFLAAKAKAAE